MQNANSSRNGLVDMAQMTSSSKKSLQKSTASPNRIGRQLKVTRSSSGSISSPTSLSRTPKKRSPKVLERGSPRSPMTQKHTPNKLSDVQSHLARLEDELKKAKEQLIQSETLKNRAQNEAEETKQQLSVISARLKESQNQLLELSISEDSRVKELWKLSQERDRVWQSEVEAIQKHHKMDSVALASALNEIQKLKKQLEIVAESEATQSMRADSAYTEIENLRAELSGTYSQVENARKELNECKGSEAHALELARDAQVQLEETMKSVEYLRLEGLKAKEDYNNLVSDLEQSKSEVTSLENLAKKLKEDLENRSRNLLDTSEKNETIDLKDEVDSLKLEISELKSALEASELRYQEECIKSTLQIRSVYDELEREKLDSNSRKVEFKAELRKAKGTIEELKSDMVIKENLLKNMSENNKDLSVKIEEIETSSKKDELQNEVKKLKEDIEDLNRVLIDKETRFQKTREENKRLKEEVSKRENERSEEREVDKNGEGISRIFEQLEGVQRANTELEAQLRRLKIQSDQWRKAAETATNMLSNVDRTISLDINYNTFDSKMDSPLSDSLEDDSFKKKNGNMLKKIGVLWKKGVK